MPERRIVTQAKGSRRLFVVKHAMSFALRVVTVLLALAPHMVWAHVDREHESSAHGIAKPQQAPSAWPSPCPGGAGEQCGCRAAAAEAKPAVVGLVAPSSRVHLGASAAPACGDRPPAQAFFCFAFSTRAPPASS